MAALVYRAAPVPVPPVPVPFGAPSVPPAPPEPVPVPPEVPPIPVPSVPVSDVSPGVVTGDSALVPPDPTCSVSAHPVRAAPRMITQRQRFMGNLQFNWLCLHGQGPPAARIRRKRRPGAESCSGDDHAKEQAASPRDVHFTQVSCAGFMLCDLRGVGRVQSIFQQVRPAAIRRSSRELPGPALPALRAIPNPPWKPAGFEPGKPDGPQTDVGPKSHRCNGSRMTESRAPRGASAGCSKPRRRPFCGLVQHLRQLATPQLLASG